MHEVKSDFFHRNYVHVSLKLTLVVDLSALNKQEIFLKVNLFVANMTLRIT